jgi:hypothetical protein
VRIKRVLEKRRDLEKEGLGKRGVEKKDLEKESLKKKDFDKERNATPLGRANNIRTANVFKI